MMIAEIIVTRSTDCCRKSKSQIAIVEEKEEIADRGSRHQIAAAVEFARPGDLLLPRRRRRRPRGERRERGRGGERRAEKERQRKNLACEPLSFCYQIIRVKDVESRRCFLTGPYARLISETGYFPALLMADGDSSSNSNLGVTPDTQALWSAIRALDIKIDTKNDALATDV
ncbi:hypothetical protein TIFTF001_029521 [Ficus carica]|uniref:Uncharacterized protein n=1 Tax=Ficus carica TaxID=3494 RepID=A0AA88J2J5_FICCA|nr:hypothetical protein TIFTF001_029521 [Ficus carica]